ncbi:ArsR family transcriptional regulator [Corynebacterium diphtheriae]|nr:ArsR family transcriptional regulator [Corynebacterium diphtheriae]
MAETGLSEATVKRHLRTLRAEGNPADVGGSHHKQYTVPLPIGS